MLKRKGSLRILTATSMLLLGVASTLAEEPEILITAPPISSTADDLGRSAEILTSKDIKNSGSTTIPNALEQMSFVSISERGAHGVQADVSVRGSTFQQVLVTIDGLPAIDPQTAHHNMDLPFPINAVQQITVIPGPGSALFGPTAFAGTIDLTIRTPKESGLWLLSSYGSFETYRFETTADIGKDSFSGTLSSSYTTSDGFDEGTDYKVWSVWGSTLTSSENASVRISAGHTDKDFGAQNFYAPFPSRELTSITLIDVAPIVELDSGWLLKAIARYRRHDDEFILIDDNPGFYRNKHISDGFTERITLITPEYTLGTTAIGVERNDSDLESSNLGDQKTFINSSFIQHKASYSETLTANIGLRVDDHSDWDTEVSPSLSIAAKLNDSASVRASGGRAIRPPSFTELYYTDPRNIGNPDLEPEEAWGFEAGFDLDTPCCTRISGTYFSTDTKNLIDWTRTLPTNPWQAMNIGEATTQGGELILSGSAGPIGWRTGYRYTDIDTDGTGMESKYALNYAKNDILIGIILPERKGFSASATVRYQDVETLDTYWLLSARVAQRIKNATIFLQGRNLLNQSYEEIPGVATAGRYVESGIELAW